MIDDKNIKKIMVKQIKRGMGETILILDDVIDDIEKADKIYQDGLNAIAAEKQKKIDEKLAKASITTTSTTTVYQPTIFDKYRKTINMVKAGYLRDLSYADAMEILRYSEKRLKRQIPMNYSCGNCLMDLVKLFSNLEK